MYKYLILDSQGKPLAHCVSRDGLEQPIWRLEVDDGDIDQVMSHQFLGVVGTSDQHAAAEGRIVRRKESVVWVEAVRELGEKLRENLRIPVQFDSYLYPVSGTWKGRAPVVGRDLSCGGVAFSCPQPLEVGEIAELVIPVTAQPLVMQIKILRRLPTPGEDDRYAAKFVDMLHEAESMVREAVFSLQLRSIPD